MIFRIAKRQLFQILYNYLELCAKTLSWSRDTTNYCQYYRLTVLKRAPRINIETLF